MCPIAGVDRARHGLLVEELSSLHPGGVYLRRDALAHGYSDKDLRRAVQVGAVARVRHGAYVSSEAWHAADGRGRHLLACRAVLLSHSEPVVLSHVSGAVAAGLSVWGADLSKVHLVRRDAVTGRRLGDVVHHVGSWADMTVHEIDGMRVLDPAACALGVAASNSVESGVVTLDSVFELGLASPEELHRLHRCLGSWPGSKRLQVSLRLAQPGAQSVGESRLRYLCWLGHVPKPTLQYVVRDRSGSLVGVTDFAWPKHRLLGEFDGRIKFEKFLRPGESASDAAFREKVREDRLRETTGWRMIRFVWADLSDRNGTISRLRSMLHV
jgi:hypothetical protein